MSVGPAPGAPEVPRGVRRRVMHWGMPRRRLCVPLPTLRELGVVGLLGALASLPVLRTWSLQWGSTEEELDTVLPGDDLLPWADHVSTRAVDIRAPREAVWPWLVQMGQDRGGFYSFDVLENLIGLDITSADRIEERWQGLAEGDVVRLAPQVALQVAVLDAPRALVLRGAAAPGQAPPPFDFSWAFTLTEVGPDRSRLVVRERYQYLARGAMLMVEPASMVSFLMSARMLRGIRDRAESAN